ncbi:MAG TPA: class I SAM-dependent methyltransferase [Bacteroidia bacterium]
MNSKAAKKFLEESAGVYHSEIVKGWEKLYEKKREQLYKAILKHHVPGNALELGSADGIMTKKLLPGFSSFTVIDGSQMFLDQLNNNIKSNKLKTICSLFEEFETDEKFDNIFGTHILEHLSDPVLVLKKAKSWLSDKGRIFIAVPNANSIHRLIGVKMGLLKQPDSLNEQDIKLGHLRVYTPTLLRQHIHDAGLNIIQFGGLMVKPISNRQIEANWSEELINAFFSLGDDLPEMCSEIYIVAGK